MLVGVIGIDETFRFKGVQEKHKVKSLKKMEGGLLCIGVCCLPVEDYSVSYSVSSLVVPKMEEGISGTGAVKNSK